jgi:hypothetical protein
MVFKHFTYVEIQIEYATTFCVADDHLALEENHVLSTTF